MRDAIRQLRMESGASWLVLFASTGTLICCALPMVLVTLGLGTAVASLASSFPILITLSQHKAWIFAGSGIVLALAGWLMYRPGRVCSTEPALAALCERLQKWNRRVYWFAVAVWGVGFFAAYLLLPIRIWLESSGAP